MHDNLQVFCPATIAILRKIQYSMSSFQEAFADVQPPTAADEARVRERYPQVFAGEEAPPPAAEELEENEFRYDDDGGNEAAPNLNRRLLANPITVNAM